MSDDSRYATSETGFDYRYRKNAFRDVDKYFKSKKTSGSRPKLLPTDYSLPLDLRNLSNNDASPDASRIIKVATRLNGEWAFEVGYGFNQECSFVQSAADFSKEPPKNKMKPYVPDLSGISGNDAAVIYAIKDVPGLFVISRALTYEQQLLWALRCLTEYADSEYTNLINLHFILENEDKSRKSDHEEQDTDSKTEKKIEDFQQLFLKACQSLHVSAPDSKRAKTTPSGCTSSDPLAALRTLRWASLGYCYDWTARSYNEDKQFPFPPALRAFADATIAPLVAMGLVSPLRSEAGIVNYYPVGSKMGAHIDDAEPAVTCPIVSYSLGLSAVFAIGSKVRDDRPVTLLLRSGDVLIQDGSARLAFHAVPRIVEDSLPLPALQLAAQRLLAATAPAEAAPAEAAPAEAAPRAPSAVDVEVEAGGDSSSSSTAASTVSASGSALEREIFASTAAEFKDLIIALEPQLAARGVTLAHAMECLLCVLADFRVNFNVRQVEDPRFGKPSEVRLKYPILDVISGLYSSTDAATKRE